MQTNKQSAFTEKPKSFSSSNALIALELIRAIDKELGGDRRRDSVMKRIKRVQ